MDAKAAARMAKINAASKGTIAVRSPYTSLVDMLNLRADDYPSLADLDAYNCCSKYHDAAEVARYNKLFKIEPPYKLVLAGPGDRPCHWRPNALCVFRETLIAGLRFPFHEFIPRLLADVQISPCQLPPNAWRFILCFMVLCLRKGLPLSVAVFRRIFQFYNSPPKHSGWVYIKLRAGVPALFNGKSAPDNNTGWREIFAYLEWEGGDWGTLFRSSFARVADGSAKGIVLTPEEMAAYATLTEAGGEDVTVPSLLSELSLREVGLSRVSERVASQIMAAKPPPLDETARMKRARLQQELREKEGEDPAFLRPHKTQKKDDLHYSDIAERAEGSQVDVKSAVFRPNWGFRKQDSVVGSTIHAVDWSKNSLTAPDYKDFVVNGGLGESEAVGCQAIATINAHFQGTLHRARSWERKSKEFETESQKRQLIIHQLEQQLFEERERTAAVQAELDATRASVEEEKEKAIDDYLGSEEYKKIMDHHDDSVFPTQYTQGWDDALAAVLSRHPGLFAASEIPSPYAPRVILTEVEVTSSELFGEDDALVKEQAADTAGTSSKGKEIEEGGSNTHTSPVASPKGKGVVEEDDAVSDEA